MRAGLRLAAPALALAALWALAPPDARADVIARKGRGESISRPTLVSLRSRTARGLASPLTLRFAPARADSGRIVEGREVRVEYDDATRTVSRVLPPDEGQAAPARARPLASRADAPPSARR